MAERVFVGDAEPRRKGVRVRDPDPSAELGDALVGNGIGHGRITYTSVSVTKRLTISRDSSDSDVLSAVKEWVEDHVPKAWRDAAPGGRSAIRKVRPIADYEAWYPTFADSGLVVATWPVGYGGLDLSPEQARVAEAALAPYNLGRLNPLGRRVSALAKRPTAATARCPAAR